MSYLGSWAIDDNLTFVVNTHTAATGAATDADAVPAYRVYEDETAGAILTGNMALLDDANTVGFYSEQIALTAANGFEVGKCYSIYISAAVAAITATVSHTFQMLADVNVAQISGDGTAADNAESFFDGTGYAGTGNTIPTVTTVGTTTTNTDMRGTDNAALAATALTDATWTDAKAGFLDAAISTRTKPADTQARVTLVDTTTTNTDVTALQDLSAAQVNAEVVDALATDTYAEPGQEAPGATVSLATKINYLYKAFRNKLTQTAATLSIYNDAGAVVDQKATVSDDGVTFTRGEIGTGP